MNLAFRFSNSMDSSTRALPLLSPRLALTLMLAAPVTSAGPAAAGWGAATTEAPVPVVVPHVAGVPLIVVIPVGVWVAAAPVLWPCQ